MKQYCSKIFVACMHVLCITITFIPTNGEQECISVDDSFLLCQLLLKNSNLKWMIATRKLK